MAVTIQASLAGTTLTLPFAVLPLVQDAAPLLPAATGCLVGAVLVRRMPELESTSGTVLIRYRLLLGALVLVAAPAISAPALVAAKGIYDGVILRNACCFAGVGLVGARFLGARMAWLPVMLLAAVTFFDGKNRYDGHVRGWAFLLHPATDLASVAITLAIAIVGLLFYAVADARPQRGLREI